MSRRWWGAIALGGAGLGLNRLGLDLVSGGWPLVFGGAPVLVAFSLCGRVPGLAAAVLSAAGLWTSAADPRPFFFVAEAWLVFEAGRRLGSLVGATTLFWFAAGGLLDLLVYGPLVPRPAPLLPLFATQLTSGVLGALLADLALRALDRYGPRHGTHPVLGLAGYLHGWLAPLVMLVALPAVVGYARTLGRLGDAWTREAAWLLVAFFPLAHLVLVAVAVGWSRRALASIRPSSAHGREDGGLHAMSDHFARIAQAVAYQDELTGLPNRRLLLDRLQAALAHARREGASVAVGWLGLDGFGAANDKPGREDADEVLRQLARRLYACVRGADTVARVKSDEFALVLPRVAHLEAASAVAHRILEAARVPYRVGGREVAVTASLGVSLFPEDGTEPELLLRHATEAMGQAKQQGGDTFRLHASRLNERAAERRALEERLRQALGTEQLAVHYQPIVETATGKVRAVEALARLLDPAAGMRNAAEFIEVAESSGLIVTLGSWVLRTACAQLKAWRDGGHDLRLAVNLSARQLEHPEVVDAVEQALAENGLPPGVLEVDVKESLVIQRLQGLSPLLTRLRRLGVRVALDDFGTGQSALAYLRRLPVDTLKLDAVFMRELGADSWAAAVVAGMVALAHRLELEVVAKGVENETQLALLRERGCELAQGFLFAPALPADEVLGRLHPDPRLL